MASLQLPVLLMLLVTFTYGYLFPGQTVIATLANAGADACFLSLYQDTGDSGVTFHELGSMGASTPATLPNCPYKNLAFNSFFKGENTAAALLFNTASASTNWIANASFVMNSLYRFNGSACILLPQTAVAEGLYICNFQFSLVDIYIMFGVFANGTFDPAATTILPNYANIHTLSMEYNQVEVNSTFPAIWVNLSTSCSSTSNVILDLTAAVTVTSSVNLTQYLPGFWLAYTVIKPNNSAAGNYIVYPGLSSNTTLFDSASDSSCWSLPIHWSDLMTDLYYCRSGCEISFILTDTAGDFFVLQTNGMTTTQPITSTGTSTGNSTGNSTGSNSSSSNATSTNSGSSSGTGNITNTTNSSSTSTGTGSNTGGSAVNTSTTSIGNPTASSGKWLEAMSLMVSGLCVFFTLF